MRKFEQQYSGTHLVYLDSAMQVIACALPKCYPLRMRAALNRETRGVCRQLIPDGVLARHRSRSGFVGDNEEATLPL